MINELLGRIGAAAPIIQPEVGYNEVHGFSDPNCAENTLSIQLTAECGADDPLKTVTMNLGGLVLNAAQCNRLMGAMLRTFVMSQIDKGLAPEGSDAVHPMVCADALSRLVTHFVHECAMGAFVNVVDDEGKIAAIHSIQWEFTADTASSLITPGKQPPTKVAFAKPVMTQLRMGKAPLP